MESESSPLAIESFSDSWLTSTKPLSENPSSTSKYHGKSKSTQNNFHFDVPTSMSPGDVLVDADQIFSNGLIKPVYEEYPSSPGPGPAFYTASSRVVQKSGAPVVDVHCNGVGFGRWRKSSEKVLRKCIGYFRPICQRVLAPSKRSGRVDDIDRRSSEVKSRTSSVQSTPSRAESRLEYDSECSIYEAVLHCKRSVDWYVLFDLA